MGSELGIHVGKVCVYETLGRIECYTIQDHLAGHRQIMDASKFYHSSAMPSPAPDLSQIQPALRTVPAGQCPCSRSTSTTRPPARISTVHRPTAAARESGPIPHPDRTCPQDQRAIEAIHCRARDLVLAGRVGHCRRQHGPHPRSAPSPTGRRPNLRRAPPVRCSWTLRDKPRKRRDRRRSDITPSVPACRHRRARAPASPFRHRCL